MVAAGNPGNRCSQPPDHFAVAKSGGRTEMSSSKMIPARHRHIMMVRRPRGRTLQNLSRAAFRLPADRAAVKEQNRSCLTANTLTLPKPSRVDGLIAARHYRRYHRTNLLFSATRAHVKGFNGMVIKLRGKISPSTKLNRDHCCSCW